jgi:hypothetical protein
MTVAKRPTKRRPTRRVSGKSALLEDCVGSLHLLGFQTYQSNGSFQRAKVVPPKYVIRSFPHESLYGTPGKKEALVVAPDGRGLFAPDEQGCTRIIIEAKWQDSSGSVDEKLPYIWEAFRASPVHNWVVVLDGRYWKTVRGKAAVNWLGLKAGLFDGRTLRVVDRKGFIDLAMKAWGQP